MKRLSGLFLFVALALAASACDIQSGSAPEPLAVAIDERTPVDTPTPERQRDEGEFPLSPEQISLNNMGLPYVWQATVVPETAEDRRIRPGVYGLPEHIEINFIATSLEASQFHNPIIYIIPLKDYCKLWEVHQSPVATRIVEEIQQIISSFPDPSPPPQFPADYPALPYEQTFGRMNDIAVHVRLGPAEDISNPAQVIHEGYRLVGRWVQTPDPVANKDLWYVYQGFSSDGAYLISFWYPVSAPALPDALDEMPVEQIEQHFEDDPVASVMVVADELNNLPADRWQPDLAILDAVIASLEIEDVSKPENN